MIISKTPLRASLFGGGSDFKEYFTSSEIGYGQVLSAALDMHVYITVNKKFDDKIRIVYSGNELVDSVSEIKHNIIREVLKFLGIEKGIEIIYMADIPLSGVGVGLASSSALTVGVLNALHAYKGEFVSSEDLAKEACHIEIKCLGQKIGIQDQYAVATGGFNRYRFLRDGSVNITPIDIDIKIKNELTNNLLLYYTGKTRDSSKILNEQSEKLTINKKLIDDFVNTVDVVYENIQNGDIDIVGRELDRTWTIKKSLATSISNDSIDYMYNLAKNAGAIGGKILGAGGGGFMLLYVKDNYKDKVRNALGSFKEVPFKIDCEGSRIVYTD